MRLFGCTTLVPLLGPGALTGVSGSGTGSICTANVPVDWASWPTWNQAAQTSEPDRTTVALYGDVPDGAV
jgi:hypothetical protein